jgi:DNA-binding XRE family transcriptional regulator
MNALIKPQIIEQNGKPAFAVIPYSEWMQLLENQKQPVIDTTGLIPHAVISRMLDSEITIIRAWREHLNVTQATVAERLGMTQPAYTQIENGKRPRKTTLLKIANALGIHLEQLSV